MTKGIDDALDVTSNDHEYVQKFNKHKSLPEKRDHGLEVDKDYQYSRAQLYSLIEKGQEVLNGVMDVADSSGSPRAYEVAGQVLKSTADIADKLMDLQKKVKEIDETKNTTTNNVTNNAIFTGSTAELQKLIKQGLMGDK
tara:strand:- start:97 stop:516 length:420 start_codon:yes stop_codon:yes gene_type:complete